MQQINASEVCHIEHANSMSDSDESDVDHEMTLHKHKYNKRDEFQKYYTELPRRYKIIERIGEGAFSLVFKAIDNNSNGTIAIKVIDKTDMNSAQIVGVVREIEIMWRLHHKNIVELYGYQNSWGSKYCFLFLEYVPGGELFNQIIKYTYFSEDLARHVMRQLASAVKYLHDRNIVHRDIKPENLLFFPVKFIPRNKKSQKLARRKSDEVSKVDEGSFVKGYGGGGIGIVKLADFGLSTILTTDRMTAETPCGTVGYTSPEQHRHCGYTKKVDLWAMGCVLYTLVVGFPPFYSNSGNSKDIEKKVARGDYKFLSPWFDEVSQECKNLISNLLTVDPEKRYSIDDLLHDPWMNKGYEVEAPDTSQISTAAADAPSSTTFDKELYSKFTHDLVTVKNIDDYFGDNNLQVISTPRAEAIRMVFDRGANVQRASGDTNFNSLKEEDNPVIDTIVMSRVPQSESLSILSDSIENDSSYSITDDNPSTLADNSSESHIDDNNNDAPSPVPFPDIANLATPPPRIVRADIRNDQTGKCRRSSISFQLGSKLPRRSRAHTTGDSAHIVSYSSKSGHQYVRSPYPNGNVVRHSTTEKPRCIPAEDMYNTPIGFDLNLEQSAIFTRRRLSVNSKDKKVQLH